MALFAEKKKKKTKKTSSHFLHSHCEKKSWNMPVNIKNRVKSAAVKQRRFNFQLNIFRDTRGKSANKRASSWWARDFQTSFCLLVFYYFKTSIPWKSKSTGNAIGSTNCSYQYTKNSTSIYIITVNLFLLHTYKSIGYQQARGNVQYLWKTWK